MTINVYTHVMDEFKRKEAAEFSLFRRSERQKNTRIKNRV